MQKWVREIDGKMKCGDGFDPKREMTKDDYFHAHTHTYIHSYAPFNWYPVGFSFYDRRNVVEKSCFVTSKIFDDLFYGLRVVYFIYLFITCINQRFS